MVLDVDQGQNICQIYLNRRFCLSVSFSLKVQRHNNPIRSSTPAAKEFFTADSTLDSPRENAFEHQSGHYHDHSQHISVHAAAQHQGQSPFANDLWCSLKALGVALLMEQT